MLVFRLGYPYPTHNQADGRDKVRADLTPAFFDICCYLNKPTSAEVSTWGQTLALGLVEVAPGLPFVLVQLSGGWVLEATLNWRVMADPAQQAAWLAADQPAPLRLALIEARTNVLHAYRMTEAPALFAQQLRAIGRQQLTNYRDQHQVEQALARAEAIPLRELSNRATYYPCA